MLCGSNSSGKSSLIQAILMLCQTFLNRHTFYHGTVVLNGALVRLGAHDDIRRHGSDSENISFSFSLEVPAHHPNLKDITSIHCSFSFGRVVRIPNALTEDEFHPNILNAAITLSRTVNGEKRQDRLATSRDVLDSEVKLYSVDSCELQELESIKKEYPDHKILGIENIGLIPSFLHIEYNHSKKAVSQYINLMLGTRNLVRDSHLWGKSEAAQIYIPGPVFIRLQKIIENERSSRLRNTKIPEELLNIIGARNLNLDTVRQMIVDAAFAMDTAFLKPFLEKDRTSLFEWDEAVQKLESKKKEALVGLLGRNKEKLQTAWLSSKEDEWRKTAVPLPVFQAVGNYLDQYFSRSVKYLGPLRNEPQAVYTSIGHTDINSVGLKGEFTAAALHLNRHRIISYESPVAEPGNKLSTMKKTDYLQVACQEWLSYLGVVIDYQTIDKGKLGYDLQVKTTTGDGWQDLTHVGVGVSQILPIVLMLLLSEPGDLIILEQPELHLHPKIQSRLCDFLVAMTSSGRQCLIETHSEYLINRLRLRIVQNEKNKLENLSSIYFVKKINSLSVFENIDINQYGAIDDWPVDFFDQTDREVENILTEAAKKRRLEKERIKNAANSSEL